MPPKRKRTTIPSPSTPSNAQLAFEREELLASGAVTMMDSSPLPPKRLRQQYIVPNELVDTSELLPSTSDALGSETAETQGVVAPIPKLKLGRPRKAVVTGAEEGASEPAVKKKRAAPRKLKKAAKTPEIVVDDSEGEESLGAKAEAKKQQLAVPLVPLAPLAPLATALKHKVKAVNAFLDTHTRPLLVREESGNNIVVVDELDLLAALIILRVDYQLGPLETVISLDDAGEMIVSWLGSGKVSVDFDQTCEIERAAQKKLAQSGAGLEDVNLVEVEIEMLLAHRKKLIDDDEPAAGFRVYNSLEVEAS